MTWKNHYNLNRQTYLTQKQQARRQKLKADNQASSTDNSHYYQAHNIKVLMSLKEYTQLNKATKKLWHNFILTFQDLAKLGFHDIIQVMKLREEADILSKDYWETAKAYEQKASKSNWNSLTEEQQTKLITYWAKERVRKDKQLLTELEQQAIQSKQYQQTIELLKFHEARGKLKCPCYACKETKQIQQENESLLKAQIKNKVFAYQTNQSSKEQCPECGKYVKELDEESGVCAKCLAQYD